MLDLERISELFETQGGQFLQPMGMLVPTVAKIKALIFDWDGVFHDGKKGPGLQSSYSEVDTAGINAIRFARFLQDGTVPAVVVISGQQNEAAVQISQRDHYQACYFRMANKYKALEHVCAALGISPEECAYMYDDSIDLPVAELAGLRILVNRSCAPVFTDYVSKHHLADYITANRAEGHAIREAMELLVALSGKGEEVYAARHTQSGQFQHYVKARNALPFQGTFTEKEGVVAPLSTSIGFKI